MNFLNKLLLSNVFFIIAIILLVLASLSKLIAWSIHKRSTLGKMDGNTRDIEKAKKALKKSFNYLAILGCLSAGVSVILAL